mgnify:CR=1 FL=1
MDSYIVMDAQASMPASCWGKYRKVAVVELAQPGVMPKQIHPRHKTIRRIVRMWDRLYAGTTDRCAFAKAMTLAKTLASELNSA